MKMMNNNMSLKFVNTDYDNPWFFNGKPFKSEDIKKFEGYVYVIFDLTNGKSYVGRKYFWERRKVKNKKQRQKTESNWKEYYGSSEKFKKIVDEKGKHNFKRIIISLHTTRGDTNYTEIKVQFQNNVLESEDFYNDTIGKYNKVTKRIIESRCVNNEILKVIKPS